MQPAPREFSASEIQIQPVPHSQVSPEAIKMAPPDVQDSSVDGIHFFE